jgi:hypothetical protein
MFASSFQQAEMANKNMSKSQTVGALLYLADCLTNTLGHTIFFPNICNLNSSCKAKQRYHADL